MLKLILVFLVIFLIVRAFVITGLESRDDEHGQQTRAATPKAKKGVSKEIGEYVEYEEIRKDK